MGQVWQHDKTGDHYLVTKIYQEVISTFAILRKVGEETGGTVRVKVHKSPEGVVLPGFTFTQEEE
jgi:hypothetical protein